MLKLNLTFGVDWFSVCLKTGSFTRICSAKERHEKCHHNHSTGKDNSSSRRCLSARHLHDTPSSGGSDRTVPYRDDIENSVSLVFIIYRIG